MNRRNILSSILLGLFSPKIPTNNLASYATSLKPSLGLSKDLILSCDSDLIKKTVESTLNKMTRQFYIENGVPQIKFFLDFNEEDDWASAAPTG